MLPLNSKIEVEVSVGKAFLESVHMRSDADYFAEYAAKLAEAFADERKASCANRPKETATTE